MSKHDNHISVKIYKFLNHHYPDLFPPLFAYPATINHPGDQPKRPQEFYNERVVITADSPFQALIEFEKKFRPSMGEVEITGIHIGREILKESSYEYRSSVTDEDDFTNDDDTDFGYEDCNYTPPVLGEQYIALTFKCRHPDYYKQIADFNKAENVWKKDLERFQAYRKNFAATEKSNKELISRAVHEQNGLWKEAGRFLNGKGGSIFAQARIRKLQEEIANLTKLEAEYQAQNSTEENEKEEE